MSVRLHFVCIVGVYRCDTMRGTSRNTFNLNFPLRRLLLQSARAARGSPPLGQRLCDAEKGGSNSGGSGGHGSGSNGGGKHDKTGSTGHSSNKVSGVHRICFALLMV